MILFKIQKSQAFYNHHVHVAKQQEVVCKGACCRCAQYTGASLKGYGIVGDRNTSAITWLAHVTLQCEAFTTLGAMQGRLDLVSTRQPFRQPQSAWLAE